MGEDCNPDLQSCPPKAEPPVTEPDLPGEPKDKKPKKKKKKNKPSSDPPADSGAAATNQRLTNEQLMGQPLNPTDPNAAGNQQQKSDGPKLSFEAACERPELFNYLDTNNFGAAYDEHTTTSIGALRSVIQERYESDTLGASGPYRAICIQVVDDGTGQAAGGTVGEPGSPEFLLNKYTDLKIEPRVRVRCRVPGLDTLPIPVGALGGKATPQQQDIIEMHTVYTANQKYPTPKVGDLVYVDWRYKPAGGPWKDPMYLGRVNEQVGISPESLAAALAEFMKNCGGGIGAIGGGSLGPGTPMASIPKDIKFGPNGIIVPPEVWKDEKARYLYFIYDKQITAKVGNLKQHRAYWLQGPIMTMPGMPDSKDAKHSYKAYLRMAKLVIWCCEKSGLGVNNAYIIWGTLKAEGRWKPTGCFGSNPNKAIKWKYDSGYGLGQYILKRYQRLMRKSGGDPVSGGKWEHEDLLDPFNAIYSMCLSYVRLIKQMGGRATPESLGAWWACPGHKKKTGAAFASACPKGARKMKHIMHYGKFIKQLTQGNLQQIMTEGEALINARPKPQFPRYAEWSKSKQSSESASKETNIPSEFLGKTKGGKVFDKRTLKTPDGTPVQEVPPKNSGVYEIASKGAGKENPPDKPPKEKTPDSTKPEPKTTKDDPKAEHKPLKEVSAKAGAKPAPCVKSAPSKAAEKGAKDAGKKEEKKMGKTHPENKAFDMGTMKTVPEGAPVFEDPPGSGKYIIIGNAPAPVEEEKPQMSGAEPQQSLVKPPPKTTSSCGSSGAGGGVGIAQPVAMGGLCGLMGGAGGGGGEVVSGGPVTAGVQMGKPPVLGAGQRPTLQQLATAHAQILGKKNGGWAPKGASGPGKKGWGGKCLQFAAKLCLQAGSPRVKPHGGKYKVKTQIHSYLKPLMTEDGNYYGAGLTLVELGAMNPPAGLCVHIKMGWHIKKCYNIGNDGHHWFTTSGTGGFFDSHHTPGKVQSAASCDRWTRSWGGSIWRKAASGGGSSGPAHWHPMRNNWLKGPQRGKRMYVHACYEAF